MATRHVSSRIAAGALAALLAIGTLASAEERPQRVRGAIKAVDGQSLTIDTREGKTVSVGLAPELKVLGLIKAQLSSIGPGTFVGAAALPRPDGSFVAQEVLVFPEAMRGTGEGHYPWDLTPDSTMTNATVDSVVEKVEGNVLRLKLKDRSYDIQVPPEAPVVTVAPGDRSLLRPGAHVFINARQRTDGSLEAGAVVVGKDGTVPPM